MGAIKQLYMQQFETGTLGEIGDEDYLYEQYLLQEKLNGEFWHHYTGSIEDGWTPELETQFWAEQPPEPFATDIELAELNDRIQVKYSDMDIEIVLEKVLGDANPLVDEIQNELNNLNNIRNGYFD